MRLEQETPSANGGISNPTRRADSYDVIVIGYGAASAVAALEGCDLRAKILLVEKRSQPGGISILSAGGSGSALTKSKLYCTCSNMWRSHAGLNPSGSRE